METLHVLIAGTGNIARVHAYCHRVLPLFYPDLRLQSRVVAAYSADLTRARTFAGVLGSGIEATDDLQGALRNKKIDIVDVCGMNRDHYDVVTAAVETERHVYCEKPLARTLEEAEDIATKLIKYRGHGQMCFHYRFYPALMRAKELIQEGRLGKVIHFRTCYFHGSYMDHSRPISWRMRQADAGGGAVYDLGSHLLDMVEWLVGHIETVRGEARTVIDKRVNSNGNMDRVDVEDIGFFLVRCESGAIGTVEVSRVALGCEDYLSMEIYGDAGSLRFNLDNLDILEYFDANDPNGPYGGLRGFRKIECRQKSPATDGFPGSKAAAGWLRGHVDCLYNYLKGILGGYQTQPDLGVGIRLQKLLTHALRPYRNSNQTT
jgi:predicted dehydrogenase